MSVRRISFIFLLCLSHLSPVWSASSIQLNRTCSSDEETNSSIDYAYSITNKTSKTLKYNTITVTLDSKLTFLGSTGGNWRCSASGRIVTCSLNSAIPKNKTSPTLTITASTPATTGTINTSASALSKRKSSSDSSYSTSSYSCSTSLGNPSPGYFNAFDSSGACYERSINTKISGQSIPLRIVALNRTRTAPDTTVNDPIEVYLLDFSSMSLSPSSSTSNCPNALSLNSQKRPNSYIAKQTVTLAGGYANVTFPASAISSIYRKVSVFTVNTSNINNFACSTDLFAIRPKDFLVTASDSNWQSAGTSRTLNNINSAGGNVHAAGQPFTLTAIARDANGNALSAYNALPSSYFFTNDGEDDLPITPQLDVSAVLVPSGASPGDANATFKPTGSAGKIQAVDATYSDSGSINLSVIDEQFAIEDAKNSCSTAVDRQIRNDPTSTPVGRFIPSLLTITALNTPKFRTFDATDVQCPSRQFTYVGQPFAYATSPEFTVKAWADSGDGEYGLTGNHRFTGRLGALSVAGGQITYTDSTSRDLDTQWVGAASITDANDGSAVIGLPPTSKLAYARSSLSAPFNAALSLGIQISDCTDKAGTGSNACIPVCLDPNDETESDGTPPCGSPPASATASFSNIAFDVSKAFRFGYLNQPESVSVANPSTAATLTLEAKYRTSSGWQTNTLDNCTDIAAENFTLSSYTDNLKQCGTLLSTSGKLSAGKSTITLSAPGNGKNGSVKLMPNLGDSATGSTAIAPCNAASPTAATAAQQTWLQCDSGMATNCINNNPQTTISFGGPPPKVNRTRFIYMRENY